MSPKPKKPVPAPDIDTYQDEDPQPGTYLAVPVISTPGTLQVKQGQTLVVRARATVASDPSLVSPWSKPTSVVVGAKASPVSRMAVIFGRAHIAPPPGPVSPLPTYTGELFQYHNGVAYGHYTNHWNGSAWTPWVKI